MKTSHFFITVSGILVLILLLPTISVAHSQGLHWGYEAGQEFYFHERTINKMEGEIKNNIEYNFIFTDSELSQIEDPLTNDSYLPRSRFDVYWLNGSPAGDQFYVSGRDAAVPIGNWSLLTKVFQAHYGSRELNVNVTYDFQIQETNTEWGFISEEVQHSWINNLTITSRSTYSKADGVLLEYIWRIESSNFDSSTDYSLSRLPMNPETQTLLTTLLAVAVLAIVVVIVSKFKK